MKKTLNAYEMKELFIKYNRDYYTIPGLESLLNYYDNVNSDMEFDPVAICCDCTEYGENASCSFDNLINDYGYLYTVNEWLEDKYLKESEYDKNEYLKALVEHLEDKTTILHISNGNYIVFTF